MSSFDIRLRMYTPGGAAGPILPAEDIDWTTPQSDVPTLKFKAAEAAVGALPDLLEIAVETWDGEHWKEPRNGRFFVLKNDVDDLDTSGLKSCTGVAFTSFILSNALLLNTGGADRKVSGPAGAFILAALEEAQARGVGRLEGTSFVTANFGPVADSRGRAWIRESIIDEISFPNGEKLTSILQILADQAFIEYDFAGRELRVLNPGTGEDLSEGTGRVTVGGASEELPVETSMEDLGTHIVVRGDEGASWTFPIGGAASNMGRLEKSVDASGVTTREQAAMIAELLQVTGAKPRKQYTVTETVQNMTARPLADFNVGDWISVRRPGGWERMRVTQLQVRKRKNELISVDVILADRLEDLATRIAKRNAALGARRAGNGRLNKGAGSNYNWDGTPPAPVPGAVDVIASEHRKVSHEPLPVTPTACTAGGIAIGYSANTEVIHMQRPYASSPGHTAGDRGFIRVWTGQLSNGMIEDYALRGDYEITGEIMGSLFAGTPAPPPVLEYDEDVDAEVYKGFIASSTLLELQERLSVIGDWIIIPATLRVNWVTLSQQNRETHVHTRFLTIKVNGPDSLGELTPMAGHGKSPDVMADIVTGSIMAAGSGDLAVLNIKHGSEQTIWTTRFDNETGAFTHHEREADEPIVHWRRLETNAGYTGTYVLIGESLDGSGLSVYSTGELHINDQLEKRETDTVWDYYEPAPYEGLVLIHGHLTQIDPTGPYTRIYGPEKAVEHNPSNRANYSPYPLSYGDYVYAFERQYYGSVKITPKKK